MDVGTLCTVLNEYLFQNVWNEPLKELRRTIKLNKLRPRSVSGGFQLGDRWVVLPTSNEPYYVFYIDKTKLYYSEIDNLSQSWKSCDDVNTSNFHLTVINDGRILYRKSIYLYHYEPSNDIIVLVSKKMMDKLCDVGYTIDNVNLNIFYDSDQVNDISTSSIYITTQANRMTALGYCAQPHTGIIINGQRRTSVTVDNLNLGDYVEVVNDRNIVFSFNIDLTTDEGKRVFIASNTNKEYTICHIPKINNPLNKVYTYNTMDVYVSAKIPDTGGIVGGLLLNSRSMPCKQITHNDFGIPEDLLLHYGQLLGTEEIVLTVQVREQSKNNVLVRDKNYIDLLYKHTDTEILNFLERSNSSLNFDFWNAEVLSDSNYVKYMMSTPSYVDSKNINTFVDAFGYQYVLALLSDTVRKFVYNAGVEYPLVFKKPAIFSNKAVIPSLFVDGIKIKNDDTTIDYMSDPRYLRLSVTDDAYTIPDGADCVINVLDQSLLNHEQIAPTALSHSLVLPSNNYSVFRRVTAAVADHKKGVDQTYTTSFVPIEQGSAFSVSVVPTGYQYVFGVSTYGSTYVLIPNDGSYIFSKSLDQDILDINPLHVDIVFTVHGSAVVIPGLNMFSTFVYLNGYTLVEGIDYRYIEHKINDNVCGTQIIIYNVSYLSDDGPNWVDVIVSRNKCVKGNMFFNNTSENQITSTFTWFDSVGTACIDGKQVINVTNTNTGVVLSDAHRSGALVETCCLLPSETEQFITSFQSDAADERHARLVAYFATITEQYTGIISIPYPHYLYSLRTSIIIRDILNDTLNVALDPNNQRMLQQLSDYEYLDAFDIINRGVNKTFIDFKGTYRQVAVMSPAVWTLIDYICKVIITDPLTYEGVS